MNSIKYIPMYSNANKKAPKAEIQESFNTYVHVTHMA